MYRKKKICPVEGCGAKPQRKLANHMAVYHPTIARKQRLKLLRNAKVPRGKYIPQSKMQTKLQLTTTQEKQRYVIHTR